MVSTRKTLFFALLIVLGNQWIIDEVARDSETEAYELRRFTAPEALQVSPVATLLNSIWAPGAKIYIYEADGRTRIVNPSGAPESPETQPESQPEAQATEAPAAPPLPVFPFAFSKPGSSPFDCWVDSQTLAPSSFLGSLFDATPAEAVPPPRQQFRIPLALETDYELFQSAGSEEALLKYLVELVSQANLVFDRDLDARFLLSYVGIYKRSDPYQAYYDPEVADPISATLSQFRSHWLDPANGKTRIPRAMAYLLAGKIPGASGKADGIGGLCETDHGYGFQAAGQLFTDEPLPEGKSLPGALPFVPLELQTLTHELGHVLGSPHTFCYDPEIDRSAPCGQEWLSGETNSWTPGTVESPPQIPTLMSYGREHLFIFHPRNVESMRKRLSAANCISWSSGGNSSPRFSAVQFPKKAQVGEAVAFTAQATDLDGDDLIYEWNFDDGTRAMGPAVSHVFSVNGTHQVSVTVSDGKRGVRSYHSPVGVTESAASIAH